MPAHSVKAESAGDAMQPETAASGSGALLYPFGLSVPDELLTRALTHRSLANEQEGLEHNERLEFLGDAILGHAVTVRLFNDYPHAPEGELAKRRAALVSTEPLADVARSIGVGEHVRLGKGEAAQGGSGKASILADTMEAIIGAVYLACGQQEAERFVLELLREKMEAAREEGAIIDPKTEVQREAARRGEPHPPYTTEGTGPAHATVFRSSVSLGGFTGTGEGSSKKHAEAAAALDLLQQLAAHRSQRKPRTKTKHERRKAKREREAAEVAEADVGTADEAASKRGDA